MIKNRLSLPDLFGTARLGIAGRPARTALSALGVALGIASLVALTGAAASNQAHLLNQFDARGANLAVVAPALDPFHQPIPLPLDAPERIARHEGVATVGVLDNAPTGTGGAAMAVRRSDLLPETQGGGIAVAVAHQNLLAAVDGEVAEGRWFDNSSGSLPVTVLGATAAERLGARTGDRVYVGDAWYSVIGVLAPSLMAAHILDSAAILDARWAATAYEDQEQVGQIASIFVRAEPGQIDAVTALLARGARRGEPQNVTVAAMLSLTDMHGATDDALTQLGLVLGGISLLIGGVGIANTMIVTVMERRGEIGLRRALGGRPSQIAAQFVLESAGLSAIGGVAGLTLGVVACVVLAIATGQPLVIPWEVLVGGPAVAVVVGIIAGLNPALRAAKVPPTVALRAS